MPCIIIGSVALLAAGLIFLFCRADSGYAIIFAISGALNIPVGILVSKYPYSPLLILGIIGLLFDLMAFMIYIGSFGFIRHIRSTVSSFIKSFIEKCKPFKNNNSKNINKYLFIALGAADILAFIIAIIVAGMKSALFVLGAASLIAITVAVLILNKSYKFAVCYLAWWIISAIWIFDSVTDYFAAGCVIGLIVLMLSVISLFGNRERDKIIVRIKAERKEAEREEVEREEAERKEVERRGDEKKDTKTARIDTVLNNWHIRVEKEYREIGQGACRSSDSSTSFEPLERQDLIVKNGVVIGVQYGRKSFPLKDGILIYESIDSRTFSPTGHEEYSYRMYLEIK